MPVLELNVNRGRAVLGRRIAVVGAATAVAVAVWTVLGPIGGVDLAVRGLATSVGVVDVACAALLAGVAGMALLAVLERVRSRARGPWTVAAVAVLAVSMLGPSGAGSLASGAALACLHLAVGATVIAGLRHTAC